MAVKAVQQIMLGSITGNQSAARETLAKIKAAGYEGIELNGFMIRPTPLLVRMLTKMAKMPTGKGGNLDWKSLVLESGLKVVGIHEDLGGIERDPDAIIREAEEFGTKYIIITGMYRFDYSDQSAMENLKNRLNEVGRQLKTGGIELLYHNHNCEFQKLSDGRTTYEYLMEETNPECVNFELDSYWPTEAGISALDLMHKLGNRMKLYHINDRGSRLKKVPMTPILKSDSMELGYGNMNLEALVAQAEKVSVDAVILESHKNWVDNSPMASLKKSAKFMNQHVKW